MVTQQAPSQRRLHLTLHLMAIIGVITAPLWVTLLITTVFYGAMPQDSSLVLSDEILNWHQTATFLEAGLDGGYYVFDEAPPQSENHLRFYAWGPGFTVITGAFGSVFGWQPYAGTLFNILVLSLGIAAFVLLARPSAPQLLLLGGLLFTSPFVLIMLPTSMQENLHQGLALVIAGLFLRLLDRPTAGMGLGLALLGVIIAASLIRVTWAALLLPLFLLMVPRTPRWMIVATFGAILIAGGLFMLFSWWGAPYPNAIGSILDQVEAANTPGDKLGTLLEGLWANFTLNIERFTDGTLLEVIFRFEYLLMSIGALLVLGLRGWQSWRGQAQPSLNTTLVLTLTLAPILLVFAIFYDI